MLCLLACFHSMKTSFAKSSVINNQAVGLTHDVNLVLIAEVTAAWLVCERCLGDARVNVAPKPQAASLGFEECWFPGVLTQYCLTVGCPINFSFGGSVQKLGQRAHILSLSPISELSPY